MKQQRTRATCHRCDMTQSVICLDDEETVRTQMEMSVNLCLKWVNSEAGFEMQSA